MAANRNGGMLRLIASHHDDDDDDDDLSLLHLLNCVMSVLSLNSYWIGLDISRIVAVVVITFADCNAQLVPDRRPPAGRGCSVESDQFPSRDIRIFSSDVSYRWSCSICPIL